jgi:predicted nucleic acid-binding protein
MLRAFLDTNIVIDIIAHREVTSLQSVNAVRFMLSNKIGIFISAPTVSTALFIGKSAYKVNNVSELIAAVLEYADIITTSKQSVLGALQSSFKDKEDAIEYFTAVNHVDYFITHDIKDFKPFQNEILPVVTPKEFMALFE